MHLTKPRPLALLRLFPFLLVLPCSIGSAQRPGPLDAATVFIGPTKAPFRRLADVDADGRPDAIGVGGYGSGYRVEVYYGGGHFQYGPRRTGSIPGPWSIEIGELDGDGLPDILVAGQNQRDVWLSLDYGLADGGSQALPESAVVTRLAELDGDGIADVVWISASNLRVEHSNGPTTLIPHSVGNPFELHVLPGDGPDGEDVFLVSGVSEVQVVYREGVGVHLGPTIAMPMSPADMLDPGDVDGDGDADLVVFSPQGSYRVVQRTAPGSWELLPPAIGGPAEFLYDVDGDGDLDGVCCGGGGPSGPPEVFDDPSDFYISLNDGDGNFAASFTIPGLGSPQLAGVADMDGNGHVDLVAGRCIYFARGPIRPLLSQGKVAPPITSPREIFDCDMDGAPDVGFSLELVYLNDGAGSFTAASPSVEAAPGRGSYHGPGYPGDFDGDGDVDLLVEYHASEALSGMPPSTETLQGMALLANDGHGGLAFGGLVSEPGASFAVDSLEAKASLVHDLNLDGRLDLITRSVSAPLVSKIWFNLPEGFVLGQEIDGFRVEAAGDAIGGPLPELYVGEPGPAGSTRPTVFIASTGGLLPTFVHRPAPDHWAPYAPFQPFSVRKTQVVGAAPGFSQLSLPGDDWLRNHFINDYGLGTAAVNTSDYSHSAAEFLDTGDVDGDGVPNFLWGPLGDDPRNVTTIYQFHPRRLTNQLMSPGYLVDLDGDGDLDVIGPELIFNRTRDKDGKAALPTPSDQLGPKDRPVTYPR